MTRMAEAYEIYKVVGLDIVGKLTELDNMMNVKVLFVNVLCDAAFLASVVITFSCCIALSRPILTIVTFMTATPSMMILATVLGIGAFLRTKTELSCADQRCRDRDMFATLLTVIFAGWYSSRSWYDESLFAG